MQRASLFKDKIPYKAFCDSDFWHHYLIKQNKENDHKTTMHQEWEKLMDFAFGFIKSVNSLKFQFSSIYMNSLNSL